MINVSTTAPAAQSKIETAVSKYATIDDVKEIEDADSNFFKSLLPDIRQMNRSQKRKFKVGILELIDSIFENQ